MIKTWMKMSIFFCKGTNFSYRLHTFVWKHARVSLFLISCVLLIDFMPELLSQKICGSLAWPLRFNTVSEIIYVSRVVELQPAGKWGIRQSGKGGMQDWRGEKKNRVEKMKRELGQAGKEEKRLCGGRERSRQKGGSVVGKGTGGGWRKEEVCGRSTKGKKDRIAERQKVEKKGKTSEEGNWVNMISHLEDGKCNVSTQSCPRGSPAETVTPSLNSH